MKSVIVHADGRHTDLAGMVDAVTYTELENLHCPRINPVLWCGGCGGSIYIRHGATRKDELFGAHHDRGDCAETLVIRKSRLSDEHKYQAEYHAVAAQAGGHTADLEVTTSGHTRVDVVIDGAVGIEVQRSQLTKAAAVDRTARSVTAGLSLVAWFTDRTSSPPWTGHVPGYRTTIPAGAWKALPPRRTATAAGLQVIEAVRCGTRSLCVHPWPCNRFIPDLTAWRGLCVDDVVEGLAVGAIRPVRYGNYVRLLSTSSIGLYEDLTGVQLTYDAGHSRGKQLPPTLRQECGRVPPVSPPQAVPPAVQEWFVREAERVQREREELARLEREIREQQEQERRVAQERRALAEQERQAQAEAYAQMMREAQRQRERREAEARQEMQDRLRYDQRIRQQIQQKREQQSWCRYPRCRSRGHPYINGTWCDEHAKKMEFRPSRTANLSDQRGDGTT